MADADSNSEDRIRQRNFEATTFSYLKRHYFDPKRLEQRTWDEFVRAMRTGRMIAFTGSMTTEDRGYPKWDKFSNDCFKQATDWLRNLPIVYINHIEPLLKIVEKFDEKINDPKSKIDKRVGFSIIGETFDIAKYYSGSLDPNPNKKIADNQFLKRANNNIPKKTIIDGLIHDLGIDRTVTLNYDFELELEYSNRPKRIADKAGDDEKKVLNALGRFDSDPLTGQIIKRLPGSRSMVSDIFNRERTDRLYEFSIGSVDHEYHVLHLHGRADAFDTMVVSYRDYDRLYRRNSLSKAPFEHALKMLYAGNPILFVGLGMSEQEVNATLQDFVGDHPYRRITPTFLLWNSISTDEKKGPPQLDLDACAVKRIDMLHRLGVLVIFDHELIPGSGGRHPDAAPILPEGDQLVRLRNLITNVAKRLKREEAGRTARIADNKWRSLVKRAQSKEPRIAAWHVIDRDHRTGPLRQPLAEAVKTLNGLLLIMGRAGTGKGSQIGPVAHTWLGDNPGGQVLTLNAEFCFDTDTLLNLLAAFLKARYREEQKPELKWVSRDKLLQQSQRYFIDSGPPVLVIVSGTERLFGTNGEPLSAEFDDMLRGFVRSLQISSTTGLQRASFVVFGTPRNKSYFEGLALQKMPPACDIPKGFGLDPTFIRTGNLKIIDLPEDPNGSNPSRPSSYLERVEKKLRVPATGVSGMIVDQKRGRAFELSVFRRAFFAAHLDPRKLEQAGLRATTGRLAVDILTVMAYIGQPVEGDVLFLVPRITHRLSQISGDAREILSETLRWLVSKELVLQVAPYPGSKVKMERYGLHGTLLTELRERSGVPLSEAVLSTAFNMSLYSAQPTDGPLPEPALHDELGQLIDWMIGAYRDEPFKDRAGTIKNPRGRPDAVAALRAGLAIIRGFYSTTALLSLDGRDRKVGTERDGALTEHAERLERLLLAFKQTLGAIPTGQPGAFYPDEIVWLYNEIGVVRLAQGSLYDARFAFDEADRFNREYVEFDDHGHNWRRITLNQIVLDIERARLDSADRRIKQIEEGIDEAKRTRIAEIMTSPGTIPPKTDPIVSHEEILAIGLTTGYRGICAHLAGETVDASEYFQAAIEILRRLDERRAFATFQRHYAALARHTLPSADANVQLELAIASAESVRQMDLVHHTRIQSAYRLISIRNVDDWGRANRQLMDALTYSDITDMYRVRVEARANLAEARMASGDYEVALEHASDALTVATRHGLSLRKISLRILIGRILIRRGDPQSGRALIESGKAAASRIGYQRAIAMAQSALSMDNNHF